MIGATTHGAAQILIGMRDLALQVLRDADGLFRETAEFELLARRCARVGHVGSATVSVAILFR